MEKRQYFGFRLSQRSDENATDCFVFNVCVRDLRKWAGVRESAKIRKGYQRALKLTRQRGVTRFLEADKINIIPNSILIAFNEGTTTFTSVDCELANVVSGVDVHNACNGKVEWGYLSFEFNSNEEEYSKLALIVDGQHRVYGMEAFKSEDIPVTVVGLIDASLEEQAFQFIVVNKKAVSVNTSDAKSIIADFVEDEQKLAERLSKVRINYKDYPALLRYINDFEGSPFFRLLDWSYNRKASDEATLVPVNAIEASLKFIRNTFPFLDDDDDSLIDFFCSVWTVVKNQYPSLWNQNPKFMAKVNIVALNEYLVESIKSAWSQDFLPDILDLDSVNERVLSILKKLHQDFWLADWPPLKDNTSYRNLIKSDLERMTDNPKLDRDWNDGLRLPNIE